MPIKWDLASDNKLLLAIIEGLGGTSKMQWEAIAANMGTGFSKEAVRQHFMKLRNANPVANVIADADVDGEGDATASHPHTPRPTFTTPQSRRNSTILETYRGIPTYSLTPTPATPATPTARTSTGSRAAPRGRKTIRKPKQTDGSPTASRKRKNPEVVANDNEDDSEMEVKKVKKERFEDQRGDGTETEEALED